MAQESKLSEFVRIRKDEWDGLRKDIELFVQRYEVSAQKVKELTRDNSDLKEQLRSAMQKLATAEEKVAGDLQQTSLALQKMRTSISRVLQQSEK